MMCRITFRYAHKQKLFSCFLAATAIFLLTAPPVHSVMPPAFYAEQAIASKIKAISTVKEIKITSSGNRYNYKRVTFQLEYANRSDTPKIFTGSCKSVDTPVQQKNIMVGGDIYHYPHVGDRVYVTVSKNGGHITSMTDMTPELEDAFRNDPGLIRYRYGEAYAAAKGEQDLPRPVPVLRGKTLTRKDPMPGKTFLDELNESGKEQEAKRQSHGHGDMEAFFGEMQKRKTDGETIPGKQTPEDIQGQFIVAIGYNDINEVLHFIKQGAGVNKANSRTGQTPIMMAESRPMAKLLVKQGADAGATDFKGGSVIHYAVTRENAVELIQYFTSLGVDPNLRGWDNEPAVFNACRYFYESNAFDSPYMLLGKTPDKAAKNTVPRDVLSALVDAGANINALDDTGNTVLHYAKGWKNKALVNLLIELGATN